MAQPFNINTIGEYLARTRRIESNGNNRAVSPTGAAGPFQFTRGTARQMGLALNDRFDLAKSTDAASRLAQQNAAHLTNVLGRTPTHGEVYLAHQQGAGGAAALLKYPNLPAAQAMVQGGAFKDIRKAAHAIAVNGGNPNAPASHFAQKWTSRFDGTRASQTTPPANFGVTSGHARDSIMHRSGPAPVQTAAATPQQVAQPKIEPKGSVLNDIDPRDPSGPLKSQQAAQPAPVQGGSQRSAGAALTGEGDAAFKQAYLESIKQPQPAQAADPRQSMLDNRTKAMEHMSDSEIVDRVGKRGWGDIDKGPAPVTAQAATPQQISQPKIEPRTVSTMQELGMRPWAGGVSAPIQRDMTTNFPMRGQRDMMGDTPYAVGMAGSQEYLNQPQAQPEMRPLGTPIDPQPAPLVPIAPAAPAATTPPPAPVETTTPSAPADTTPPGPEAPATPSDTTPAEGGGGGNMLAGLMDALSNLGGGGEGGGAQQPANPAPQAAPIYMPDMPSQSAPFDMQLAQKGQLADQPVQGISNLAQLFDVKPIGQAPAIQMQNMGQANPATKRLFT
jgi:hypothetical protein